MRQNGHSCSALADLLIAIRTSLLSVFGYDALALGNCDIAIALENGEAVELED
jgi:hypothetical protein